MADFFDYAYSADVVAQAVSKIYQNITHELLMDISKKFDLNAPHYGSPEWEMQKLAEFGYANSASFQTISLMVSAKTGQAEKAFTSAIKAFGNNAVKHADESLKEAVKKGFLKYGQGILPMSDRIKRTTDAIIAQATSQFNLVGTQMLASTINAYKNGVIEIGQAYKNAHGKSAIYDARTEIRSALDSALVETATGSAAMRKATAKVLKKISETGITGFVDKGGHKWSAEAYVNLVARTSLKNVQTQMVLDRGKEYGLDIFYWGVKYPSRPRCYEWQGKIISESNNGGYEIDDLDGVLQHVYNKNETSWGEPAGLGGCNCGHTLAPFFPGLSKVGTDWDGKDISYDENRKMYAETQTERALEREVRHAKTEVLMLENAGIDKNSPEYQKSAHNVKQATANYKQFLEDHKIVGITGRTSVYGYSKTVAGHVTASNNLYEAIKAGNQAKVDKILNAVAQVGTNGLVFTDAINKLTPQTFTKADFYNACKSYTAQEANIEWTDNTRDFWQNATDDHKKALFDYTEGSGGFNHPLRGQNNRVAKTKEIADLQEAIRNNPSPIKEASMVCFGLDYDGIFGALNCTQEEKNLYFTDKGEFAKRIVGRIGGDKAFRSAAPSDTGTFTRYADGRFYAIAPEGTKGIWAEPVSYYSTYSGKSGMDWDGQCRPISNYGGEQEILLQDSTYYETLGAEYDGSHLNIFVKIIKQGG